MRTPTILIGTAALLACGAPQTGLVVSDLTLNDAPPTTRMRAGYLTLTNDSDQPRELVSVQSNAFGLAEVHRTETVDGVSRMREIKNLRIDARETIQFEPFGRHVMLMRPHATLRPDEAVTVTLCFDNDQCVTARSAP